MCGERRFSPTFFRPQCNATQRSKTTKMNKLSALFFLVLLVASPPLSDAVSYIQLRSLFSLGHSLAVRIANLRAARGDHDGALRARALADKLERGLGLGFWSVMWSMGWDYVRNYAWRDTSSSFDVFGIASDFNALLSSLSEIARLESESEKAAWVARNYQNILRRSRSLFSRLLSVFSKSGPLRELVETLQKEMEGDLLRDCLELGTSDLKGLVQIFKDLVLQYASVDSKEL